MSLTYEYNYEIEKPWITSSLLSLSSHMMSMLNCVFYKSNIDVLECRSSECWEHHKIVRYLLQWTLACSFLCLTNLVIYPNKFTLRKRFEFFFKLLIDFWIATYQHKLWDLGGFEYRKIYVAWILLFRRLDMQKITNF